MKSALQSKHLDKGESMSPIRFLKKYIPNSPDWLLGGLFLVCLVWLIVLSEEIPRFLAGSDIEDPTSAWYVRLLSAPSWVLVISIDDATGGPLPFMTSSIGESIIILFLCLIISGPMYFIIGALLAIRMTSVRVLLLVANFLLDCLCTFFLVMLYDY